MPLVRLTIVVHRSLGVALCLVFLLWFLSGIGMMYWSFPAVTAADRLAHGHALEPSAVTFSPAGAFAVLGPSAPPSEARLDVFDGRPVYRFLIGEAARAVYADTAERVVPMSKDTALRVASSWTGRQERDASVETIHSADQWTVEGPFLALMPLWKYSWPDGEQAYVSPATGDVVQYTTTMSRVEAYLGPIPHWLYFAPLRRHSLQWRRVVIWSSGMGAFGAMLGLILGVSTYSPTRRYRHGGAATSIPYRGRKRWHMALGLLFGLGAVTWAFSGMLSMNPAGTTASIPPALLDPPRLAAFEREPPREALRRLAGLEVRELELASFSGEPVYLAHLAGGGTLVMSADGEVRGEFNRQRLVGIVRSKSGRVGVADVRVLDRYDAYYLDRRRQRPLPVIAIALADAGHTRYYVDPKTARVVGTYSSSDWVTRWLYHGLHSLDFPWLYEHRPLWDIVVITFMLGGAALSVTSLLLAWRVVGRALTASAARTP